MSFGDVLRNRVGTVSTARSRCIVREWRRTRYDHARRGRSLAFLQGLSKNDGKVNDDLSGSARRW